MIITITLEHLHRGRAYADASFIGRSTCCPVALAVADLLGVETLGSTPYAVTAFGVWIANQECLRFDAPRIRRFIGLFDYGDDETAGKMLPLTTEVRLIN